MQTPAEVIAVIDDDPSVLRATGRLLSVLGYQVELYACPEKSFEAVLATKAICLIVDIELSGKCGIEFSQHLRKAGSTIPVIFMTAASENETYRSRALQVGYVAYLYKPFSADALLAALRELPGRS